MPNLTIQTCDIIKRLLFLCCFTSLLNLHAQTIPFSLAEASRQPKYETRAVWITVLGSLDWPDTKATSQRSIEQQKKEICHQLDQFKAANFNTILMQTRVRGDVIYPSQIEAYTDELTGTVGENPGYNPLSFIIDECHKRGMEFHAWIVAIPLGSDKHIKKQGSRSIAKRKPSICAHYRGFWYLNPGHPEAKEYLFSIVKEIVTHYDVDGINFDYIRYPDGKQRFPDQSTYRKYGNGKSLAQWRRDNLTEMVRYIYKGIKEIKPYVKVGSSPLGKYRDTNRYSSKGWNAYHTVYQDARLWLQEGIHDIIFPMVYFREENFYPFVLDWKENCNGRFVAPGLGIYFLEEANWPLSDVEQQIYFTRSAHLDGQAYFRARFILRNISGSFDAIKQEIYPYPALNPPMLWQDSIAPTHPTDLILKQNDGKLLLEWQPSQDNSVRSSDDSGIRYNIYASSTLPVDTDNPRNLVATYLKDNHYEIDLRKADGLHFSVTAVDCYGNESREPGVQSLHTEQPKPKRLHIISLPKVAGAQYIVVTDIYNREILRETYKKDFNIGLLEKGAYTINITNGTGMCLKRESIMKTE